MEPFYIRTNSHWIKVSRRKDKGFVFALGYKDECVAYHQSEYSNEFVQTVKDARSLAKSMVTSP